MRGGHTKYWLLNLASAVVLVVLLSAHMFGMHLDGLLSMLVPQWRDPMSWQHVVARAGSVAKTVSYIVLLGAGLYHGFYGLRTMLVEFFVGARVQRTITALCVAAGITLFVVGSVTTIVFHVGPAG